MVENGSKMWKTRTNCHFCRKMLYKLSLCPEKHVHFVIFEWFCHHIFTKQLFLDIFNLFYTIEVGVGVHITEKVTKMAYFCCFGVFLRCFWGVFWLFLVIFGHIFVNFIKISYKLSLFGQKHVHFVTFVVHFVHISENWAKINHFHHYSTIIVGWGVHITEKVTKIAVFWQKWLFLSCFWP